MTRAPLEYQTPAPPTDSRWKAASLTAIVVVSINLVFGGIFVGVSDIGTALVFIVPVVNAALIVLCLLSTPIVAIVAGKASIGPHVIASIITPMALVAVDILVVRLFVFPNGIPRC